VVLKLFQLAYEHCRRAGVTDMVASLTERHIGFYRRFLGFQPLGELNEYTMANGLPVQVHCLPDVGVNPLIKTRANHLLSDVAWRAFWLNQSQQVLEQADTVAPWAPWQQQYFFGRCPVLSDELDKETEQVLELEYRRFGAAFGGAPRA
jgi:hypothetical protein